MDKLYLLKTLLTIALLQTVLSTSLVASNILSIGQTQCTANQLVVVDISIDNGNQFVAFQVDIPIPNEFVYVSGSATLNSVRTNGHLLNATLLSGGTLRIFGYSFSNALFLGNTGVVASFQLASGSNPGYYALNATNAVIGNINSQNILTSAINGSITVNAPEINTNLTSIDFGDIPLGGSEDRPLRIYNNGNIDLHVQGIFFDNPNFVIVGNSSYVISPGNYQNLTVRFNSNIKGNYQNHLYIVSDDPDEDTIAVTLAAVAFAVNEIHTGNMSTRSGYIDTLRFSVNNMEPFVGFQFDLRLPQPLQFIQGSAVLSSRKADHSVACNIVQGNMLRVVAYSPGNNPFSGNSGIIVSLAFEVNGIGGYYPLTIENAIIGDSSGTDVLSAYYNGSLQIAAGDISCSSTVDLGDVSIFDTTHTSLSLHNVGNDTLKVQALAFAHPSYYSAASLPIYITPTSSYQLPISFHNANPGTLSSQLMIYSNDPDESPKKVNLTASSYIPNQMAIESVLVCNRDSLLPDTFWVSLGIENYEDFVAFQCDITFPTGFVCLTDSTVLSSRAQDHIVYSYLVSPGTVRLFAYSLSLSVFSGGSGSVAHLCFVNVTSPPGNYALSLRNAIVGNQQSQNILHSTLDGTVAINQSPVVTVSSDITICYGDSVPIGANGAAAYTWDQGLGSGSSHTVAPVTSTIFSVTGTNANGCTGTNEVSVLIYPEPDQSSAGADALNIADSIYFLQANLPNIGVGVWKIVSGQGGYLADSLNPNSAFSGLTDTLYLLEWKISGICSSTSDSVLISFAEPPQYARIDVSVRYANNASTPLTGVEVVLSGDSLTRTGLTDTNGNISFDSLPLGDYYITASHTGAWISGASNSVDALAIMQHYVHLISLSGIYLQCAADVNASGFINATDALQVAQRFTGLVQAFGAGDWCFSPGNIDLLNPENYSVVIQGVMVGDVNGSYVPPQSK